MLRMLDLRWGDKASMQECSSGIKEAKCWRTIRTWMMGMVVPCCGCQSLAAAAMEDASSSQMDHPTTSSNSSSNACSNIVPHLGTTVTGTLFGHKKGRVNFCVQDDPRAAPLLLLELALPTHVLVKEMHSGLLRIALKCEKGDANMVGASNGHNSMEGNEGPLFNQPVWAMFCNGRKVGFAMRRHLLDADRSVLNVMQSVSAGAGVIPTEHPKEGEEDDDIIYMRAAYKRVVGSSDSESFHMINPEGETSQELSIFLLRS